jgi:hypothetical protein
MSDFVGMNLDLKDFDRLLRQDDLIETPVDIQTFVQDKEYLGLPPLSDIQLEIVRHSTQIFKERTLISMYGEEEGSRWYKEYTDNEVICMLGKGSGKDHCARISMAYTVYLIHCLRDPLIYYGKAHGVYIDLLNLAVNAQQAQRVFFEPFKKLLLRSPYFNRVGFEPRVSEIFFFSRPVRCFSGHSESEGWEGYEVMTIILDEIAAFKTDAELRGETRSKGSASAIYNMSKLSIMSRFPEIGKVILLSFPRYKGDFIQQRYINSREKKEPKTWSIKAATWEVNPTIKREQLESEYIRNPVEARSRFECEPPNMEDAYFRDPDLVRKAFMYNEDPMDEEGNFKKTFLDYPAEIQGLILGLVKVVTLEEDPNKVIAKMGIKDIPALEPNQEYEFNLSSAGLTLRIVTLGKDYKQLERTDVWKSSSWGDVKKLLAAYNIDQSFKDLVSDLKKLKNPRSRNRIKGIFKSMVSIKSGEVNTPKGDNKQMALDAVGSMLENMLFKGLEAGSNTPIFPLPVSELTNVPNPFISAFVLFATSTNLSKTSALVLYCQPVKASCEPLKILPITGIFSGKEVG